MYNFGKNLLLYIPMYVIGIIAPLQPTLMTMLAFSFIIGVTLWQESNDGDTW